VNFVGKLAQATGADVAASSDLTGAAAKGGDWVLEVMSGTADVATLAAEGWQHALAIASLSPADDAINVPAGSTSLVMTLTGRAELTWQAGKAFYLYKDGNLIETFTWSSNSGTYSGTGNAGGTIVAPGGSVTPNGTTITINPGGALVAGSSYYVTSTANAYVEAAAGAYGSITALTTWNFSVVAADSTPPTFDVAPAVGTLTTSGFTPSASLNESGTAYYVVVADGATAPSVAQVKAGQNASSSAALASGTSAATTGAFDASFSAVSTLSASTAYDVYFVAKDAANNDQTSVTKVDVTTAPAAPAANTPPTLDATKSPTLGTIAANLAAPSANSTTGGVLVSSLIDSVNGSGLDNYTDANSDPAGIAITKVSSNGTLYYSTNGGTTWAQLTGTVSETSALTLKADADTYVYFKPNTGVSGSLTDAITFKAWDQNGGFTNGQTGANISGGVVGTLDTTGLALGLAVSGNYAYVADFSSGLQIINISTPASPTLVGTYGSR